ncbi:hypothetical protein HNQ93_002973 [Hymenobacter luteus]|uniref:Uncharacterized protein n=2 Tax=Hymenobacter TaxID=89966 RepID=A0A7W9T1Y7_9BACT|nr:MULTISPECIES: hypothetical protein [Hymenobacter]MBB4603209.1 hypothetical protein [Hymenobacter latericoloratus]MBB6060107.1 hypothetical protein [Hymenobacter luteus]
MKNELQYMVCCQLTLAELSCGQVVSTRQVKQLVASPTAELPELFTDLYEQFRSPQLLGLQITSIRYRRPATHRMHDEAAVEELQEC